ncbi:MAG: NAD(P)-dependent alcohol dehydrogenase [Nevskiaceae bacterium]|nr:MAG: NAD(P)-dependent alcohol dehydrogenase [Nevskiaceae bacterium]
MSDTIRAFAAAQAGAALEPFTYDAGPLGAEQVELRVEYCGICHSDLSMLDNEWRNTRYPFVPGHEIVGVVERIGAQAKNVKPGQRVGLGWRSGSCLCCRNCLSGDLHMCRSGEETIVGRHGGFAEKVRCHWSWALPIPEGVSAESAGPLFCGGITVFTPIAELGVKPTHRVGVVGIGGLGHMALAFLNKWGCEVTAFTSSAGKRDEALRLGAHQVVSSTDKAALKQIAGTLDFILVTVNVPLEWAAYTAALKPHGRLHFVGAVLAPLNVNAFNLIGGQKSISGSPVGSPVTTLDMLEFCARHGIAPIVEQFPMSRVNEAMAHLRAGKARYRIVLKADF